MVMLAMLKQEGKGETTHYPFNVPCLWTSTYQLGCLTKYSLRSSCTFSAENMHKMLKSSFVPILIMNPGDELIKNHRDVDKENSSGGSMPEVEWNRFCSIFQKNIFTN